MKFSVFISILLCAIGLYLIKHLAYLYNSGKLYETLKRAIKKALRLTIIGTAALGLILFTLSHFALVRKVGFSLFTTETIDSIRLILEFLFETDSFQISLQILGSVTICFIQLSLLFSILGSFVTKYLVYPQALNYEFVDYNFTTKKVFAVDTPGVAQKLFLRLGNLRI